MSSNPSDRPSAHAGTPAASAADAPPLSGTAGAPAGGPVGGPVGSPTPGTAGAPGTGAATATARKGRPARLTKPSVKHVWRTSVRAFIADNCIDLASGLAFRMLLSFVPALVALVSILSLLGQSGTVVTQVLDEVERIAPTDAWSTIRPMLETVLDTPSPGWGLVLGLVTALWSASGYVKAFGRAMNTVVGVREGRGFVAFNLIMYMLTLLLLVLGAVVLLVFVLSGPIAEAVGGILGMSGVALTIWNIARWFVLAGIVVLVVAVLYHSTPNIKHPRFRWLSIGALIAIIVSILASLGFSFYVSQFGAFNATYGALAGVIILLLWVFIINAILLFGAQLDCEIERARELQDGLPAEEHLQLPVRSTKASDKQSRKYAEDVRRGRNLRLTGGQSQDDPTVNPPARH